VAREIPIKRKILGLNNIKLTKCITL